MQKELKETGIEWIGEVPIDWDTLKIKYVLSIPITDGPHETPEFIQEGVPFISAEAIKDKEIDFTKRRGYISREDHEKYSKKCSPEYGDIFMVKSGATTGNVAKVKTEKEFSIWSPLALFRADDKNVTSNYMFYFLQSNPIKKSVEYHWSFGTQQNIGMGVLSNLFIALPDLNEQRSIAVFLDRKTEAIDGLIQKKEQLIERLKEKRQALITRAVTRGLDPNVPMKDSGIEWLGEIPEHWERIKLKFVVNIFGRIGYRGYTTDDIVDEGQGAISLSPSNIKNDQLVLTENTYISWDKYHESPEIKIYENDIILVKTGSTIGKTAIIPEDTPEMTINPQLVVLKDIRCNPEYLYYLTASPLVKYAFEVGQAGGSTPSISQEKIENFELVLPQTLEEQNEILNYLKSECKEINEAITHIENVIDKLKEYRQSLISAAVTGKIDVRDEVKALKGKKKTQTANIFFKRRVLAAKILDDLHAEPTMGKRKLQKILYLLEKEIEAVELKGKYQKDAAGPFDNRMMRSIKSQLRKAKWFKQVERENGYGYKYVPMVKKDEYKEFYSRYWDSINSKIEELIELFRPAKTNLLSLVATLYACWNDFIIKNEDFDGKKLIYEARYNWHEEKKDIPYKDWKKALKWMWRNELIPQGTGELTKEKN